MIKLIKPKEENPKDRIYMGQMKPMDVARIIGQGRDGTIVMRTQSNYGIEIMNLSNPIPGECWILVQGSKGYEVELLPPGTVISFEVV